MDETTTITGHATAKFTDSIAATLLLLPRTLIWIAGYSALAWGFIQFVVYPRNLDYALYDLPDTIEDFIWHTVRWCLFYVLFLFAVQLVFWFRNSKPTRERYYLFDAEQFTTTDGTGIKTIIPWDTVRSAHKNRRILMLRYSQRACVYILLRAFSEADATCLYALAAKHQK
jgi:hypothetical protein